MSDYLHKIQPPISKKPRKPKYGDDDDANNDTGFYMSLGCHGFDIHINKDITKGNYVSMIGKLGLAFNTNMVFEKITGGGIKYASLPEGQYKTIRFTVRDFVFPWIDDEKLLSWTGSDKVLYKKGLEGWVRLKTSQSSNMPAHTPEWTLQEVGKCINVFAEFGIKCGELPFKDILLNIKISDYL